MFYKSAALILEKNKLFVVKKKNNHSHFILPGGKLEKDETAKQALIRELQEEISLIVTENEIDFLCEFEHTAQFGDDKMKTFLFHLTKKIRTEEIAIKNEIATFEWIELSQNRHDLATGIRDHAIPEALKILSRRANND